MPVPYLAPFSSFEQTTFHVGGSPETVAAIGTKWVNFGQQATAAAAALRAINDGGYIGTEGEKYKELVNSQLPGHLDVTGKAHEAVGNAINKYFHALTDCLSKMGLLVTKSRGDHGMVQAAVTRYNTAELAAAAAKTKAGVAKGAALLGSVTPAGPALAATAATAETAAATAEAERAAAWSHYEAVKATWDGDVSQAGVLKNQLGTDVTTQVGVIDTQARKRFQENPTGLAAVWAEIKNFVSKHADVLSFIADALQIIGSILLFIPGLNIIGAVLVGIGVALKGLLALCGEASWGEFAFDLLTSLPGGAIFKGIKAGKMGAKAATMANKAANMGTKALSAAKNVASKVALKGAEGLSKVAGEKFAKSAYSKITRGGEICFAAEPVDMATGAMVDYETDVAIPGVLPLVIDRNSNSGHELGRALGPQWVSRMDCRIEICPDEVLMLTPDGALVTFPAAPLDGSEVRADGRPWLLSFTDGAYRVRDVASGVVYVFATATEMSMVRPVGPVEDVTNLHDPDSEPDPEMVGVTVGGYGYKSASVAGYAGIGFEVGLSAVIHRTGHMIEYGWDQASGLMTSMRRSDGTMLELVWDRRTHRMASVWLKHQDRSDEEPVRLISYEYDAHGRLRRVINSAAGALSYHYDQAGRVAGWTDRNGVSYTYVFDDEGRVVTQAGTGGMFANSLIWLDDEAPDAPVGGKVCVLVETAGEFAGDPLELGDAVIPDRLQRLEALPLVKALREGGLAAAGLVGQGRDGARSEEPWQVPAEWLHDEVLGDVRPTVYRSTVAGDVWRIITPSGACVDYAYNEFHKVTMRVAADGGVTETQFDADGFVTSVVYPDGSQMVAEPAAWGTPARVTGRDGLVTEFEVDAAGSITAVTNPAGLTTRYHYDWLVSGLVAAGSVDPAGVETQVDCDLAGRIIATTDASGRRWSVVRDAAGRVVESMDPVGNTTVIDYSPEGWAWQVTNPDGSQVRATFDGEGNVIHTINEIGAVTATEYTVFDKPVVITDAAGGVTRLVYNTQMDVCGLVNADGRRWEFDFDLDGTVIQQRDYNGLVTRFEQDLTEGWSRVVDAAGGVTTTWQDSIGRVIQQTDSAGVDTIFSYNSRGFLDEVANNDAAITYAWDEYGRLVSESTTLVSGETTTINVGRDGYGRTNQVGVNTAGTQTQQAFVFDDAGEVSHVDVTHGGRELAHVALGMDAAGRRDQLVVGSVVRQFGFDECGRVVNDVVSSLSGSNADGHDDASPAMVAGRAWAWRADNTVSVVNDVLAGVARFDVDVLGRVTGVSRDKSSIAAQAGATTSVNGSDASESYGYSAAGMLTSIAAPELGSQQSVGGVALARSARSAQASQSAQPTGVETRGTLVTRVGKTSYTYDKLGRVTETVTRRSSLKPLVKRFEYAGSTGQVTGFSSSDAPGVRWVYSYDGLGRRVAKTCLNTDTDEVVSRQVFAYVGNDLVAEYTTVGDASGVVGRVWVQDPGTGELIGQVNLTTTNNNDTIDGPGVAGWSQAQVDAVFYALVADLAGAPQELIDTEQGSVVGHVTQSLFGRRQGSGVESPVLFAGQYEDAESGWVYNRFRFYDPAGGVYGAQDPLGVGPNVGTPQGYVHNPITWADALGLKAHKVTVDELKDLGVSNPKEVAEWLNRDSIPNTGLYHYADDAGEKYIGISNDLERRASQHGDRFGTQMQEYTPDANAFSQGADSLSRNQNRALEEALISQNGMKKDGGILENASHSIGTKRDIYDGAMKWAHSFGNANIPGVSFP